MYIYIYKNKNVYIYEFICKPVARAQSLVTLSVINNNRSSLCMLQNEPLDHIRNLSPMTSRVLALHTPDPTPNTQHPTPCASGDGERQRELLRDAS